jgi:predicted amidohydrolase
VGELCVGPGMRERRMAVALASPARTIGDVIEDLAPSAAANELAAWPPDVFGITGVLLALSGAFRLSVSPPNGEIWPPSEEWNEAVSRDGRDWASVARPDARAPEPTLPAVVADAWRCVLDARAKAVGDIDVDWGVAVALLTLHAAADEACRDLGSPRAPSSIFGLAANLRLASEGTLARLPVDRIRVLPKLRTPTGGVTVRSLSRHVAFLNAELETTWYAVPQRYDATASRVRFRMLIVPWPRVVNPRDFRRVDLAKWPLNMDRDRFGFFAFEPSEPLDRNWVDALVDKARECVGGVDAVVFPELALTQEQVTELEPSLWKRNVNYLIAGVRAEGEASLGSNYVHLGIAGPDNTWRAYKQCKHHRWCLDEEQIYQYHLGSALHPKVTWWEGIEIPPRSRVFVVASQWLTICPVICEDLARIDPTADCIHAVGPSLVIALLLDGPQLASRWSARYASALADDPGSSVLTVTSLGMSVRARPEGMKPSRIIALWRDRQRGTRLVELDRQSEAALLTTSVDYRESVTADGRRDKRDTPELVLSGIEQISAA